MQGVETRQVLQAREPLCIVAFQGPTMPDLTGACYPEAGQQDEAALKHQYRAVLIEC